MKYVSNYNNCSCNNKVLTIKKYPLWQNIAYYNESSLPIPIDETAGSWPLFFFYKNSIGHFFDSACNPIDLSIKNPNYIDYKVELDEVNKMQEYLFNNPDNKYIEIAKFWGAGVPVNQWCPIALQLISSYKVTPPESARIMHCLQATISDAFNITWYYKFLYDCPRPCQLNHNLKTILNTPRFPSYPSGHSVVSGAAATILSKYFPKEMDKLNMLANDASISRLYGGIHFRSDLNEGLKLGKKIGSAAINIMEKQCDNLGNPVDYKYNNFADAPILPDYFNKN